MALRGTPLESFFVELGFDIDTSQLSKFEKDLKGARESVLSIAAIAAAAAAAIGLFVFSVAESVDILGDFAEQEKVSVEAIQEFGHAAQLNGSSVDAIKSSIQGLNRVTGEAINGLGRGKKAFETFGLQAKDSQGNVKTFDSLLLEISDKMQGMSRQAAISMAEKLGLDRSLIPLLMKGRSAIEEYRKEARELGITSQEDADLAGKFTDEYARLKMAFLSTARGIAISLMPQILNAITLTKNWIVQNREFIRNSIAKALEFINIMLGTMWDYLYRVIAALGSFASWVGKSKFALYVLIGALGVIAKLAFYDTIKQIASGFMFLAKMITLTNIAALATTAIIGLLILAVGLIIDDFINWREGNDSLIGDLVKDFPQILDILNMVADSASAFVDYWLDLWNTISGPTGELFSSIFDLASLLATTLWPIIKLVFQGWFEIIKILLPMIISFVATVIQYLVQLVSFLIVQTHPLL